jgi:uncharacterized protein (DUF433 family)
MGKDYIIVDPAVCHGTPVFAGTRIMVYLVLEMIADGESVGAILAAYPALTKEHVAAALRYAASMPEIRGGSFTLDLEHAVSH